MAPGPAPRDGGVACRLFDGTDAVLDEAAFWLGALASGEAGMTTELRRVFPAYKR